MTIRGDEATTQEAASGDDGSTAGTPGDPATPPEQPPVRERRGLVRAAISGVVAALAGLAAGHLIASLFNSAASPVLAVGSAVIDRVPTPLKDWAIRHFGTMDKPILVGSVALGTLVLAAIVGLLARRRFAAGAVLLVLIVAAALGAALTRPTATVVDALPSVVAAVVGLTVLVLLLPAPWLAHRRARRARPSTTTGTAATSTTVAGGNRRTFVLGSGAVVVGSAAALYAGQRLGAVENPTGKVALPTRTTERAPALPTGLDAQYPGITPLQTPNAQFYRVDTSLSIPKINAATWKLTIGGDVRNPYTLTYADIQNMPLVERNITMTCVSNEVGGPYVGAARWLGVRVSDLLAKAGVIDPDKPGRQVFSTSTEGFTISTPLGALTDDREALLAIGMNGTVLPPVHGFPARLVTPGLYGFVGSTKWVTSLRVTDYADAKARAYWTKRGWAINGPIKPSARIDMPASLGNAKRGTVTVGGTAWAQTQGVIGVQVSVDNGPWRNATLGPQVNVQYWRQWVLKVQLPDPGVHAVRARVVYGRGKLQSAARAGVFPSGSSGIQEVVFNVT